MHFDYVEVDFQIPSGVHKDLDYQNICSETKEISHRNINEG